MRSISEDSLVQAQLQRTQSHRGHTAYNSTVMYIVRAISNGTYLSDYSRPKEKTFLQETQFNTRRPRHINYAHTSKVSQTCTVYVIMCMKSLQCKSARHRNSRSSPPPPPAARFHSDQGISTTLGAYYKSSTSSSICC